MDSSLIKPFQLFFLTFAFLILFSCADLIGDVCAKTRNPSQCSKALRSDPRSGGADLKLLGQISIDLATAGAKSGLALVTKLRNGVTDPKLKNVYDTCVENYDDGVENFAEARLDFKKGDYQGVNLQASSAETDFDTCDDGFSDLKAAEPKELKAASQNAEDLSSIVLVISNLLNGGKM